MRTIFSVKRKWFNRDHVMQDDVIIYVAPSQMMQTGTREPSYVQVFQVSEEGYNLAFMDERGIAYPNSVGGRKYIDFAAAIEDIRDGFYGAFVGEVNSVESHS